MKKVFLIFCMSLILPCYANVEFCFEQGTQCRDFKEDLIESLETTMTPGYGVIVNLKSGYSHYMPADTKRDAISMFFDGYKSLQEYYGWNNTYLYKILEKQDKARLKAY